MQKVKKWALFLLIFFFLILIITIIPSERTMLYGNGGKFCNSGSQYFCWTSLPYWECRTKTGGVHCVDPEV